MQSGPPPDWMERVRRGAKPPVAHLRRRAAVPEPAIVPSPPPAPGSGRQVRVTEPPPASPQRAPERARTEEPRVAPRETTPRRRVPSESERQEPPEATRRAVQPGTPATEQSATPVSRGARPEVQPGHSVERPVSRFAARETPVAERQRREPPARVPQLDAEPRAPAPRAEERRPADPGVPRSSASFSARPLRPSMRHPGRPVDRPVDSVAPRSPAVAPYPWGEEPTAARRMPPEPASQEELGALLAHGWPALAGEPGREARSAASTFSEASEDRLRLPWPELLEPPPTESAEGASLLLQWERLNRLDREQRGE
jgi:hypothetical protein